MAKVETSGERHSKKEQLAKRDFHIFRNGLDIQIKKGDNISKLKIPKEYLVNLKTEKVI